MRDWPTRNTPYDEYLMAPTLTIGAEFSASTIISLPPMGAVLFCMCLDVRLEADSHAHATRDAFASDHSEEALGGGIDWVVTSPPYKKSFGILMKTCVSYASVSRSI